MYKSPTPRATFAVLAAAVTIMLGLFIDLLATYNAGDMVQARGPQPQLLASPTFEERHASAFQWA
jgi:hypothetical protein